jgi:hypothetical protein
MWREEESHMGRKPVLTCLGKEQRRKEGEWISPLSRVVITGLHGG